MDILLWHEILEPYELAVKELQVKFRHLIKEHHGKGLYSPIESVSGRVKSVSSILEKMQRKGIVPEEMEEQVEDIAGIRIICQFVEDIEKVADLIQKRSDIEIKSEKDYIRHMKDSGIGYGSVNHPVDRDPVCGYNGIIGDVCPRCGRHDGEGVDIEVLRKIKGYIRDVRSEEERLEAEDKMPNMVI